MPWLIKLKNIILKPKVEERSLEEKRLAPRVHCFIEAHFTPEDDSPFDGNITVLEITGMRIVTPRKIIRGQKFVVSVDSFSGVLLTRPFSVEKVNAEVVWCQKKKGFSQYIAGIKFIDDPEVIRKSWVHYVLDSFGIKQVASCQRRKNIRVQTSLPVTCFLGKKKNLQGVVYDIGLGGLRMSFRSDIPVGTEVMFHIGPYKRLPVLKCRGRVRRSSYNAGHDEFTIGVEFIEVDDKMIRQIGSYVRTLLEESSI